MTAVWKDDLIRGDKGEENFITLYPEYKKAGEGWCAIDFIHRESGETVELKTDYYDMNRSPNFFIETISNDTTGSPGGPFREQSTYFVYYFIKNNKFYWFRTSDLLDKLSVSISKYRKVFIQNFGYRTVGILVPRTELLLLEIV